MDFQPRLIFLCLILGTFNIAYSSETPRDFTKPKAFKECSNSSGTKKTEGVHHSIVTVENTNAICRAELVGRIRFRAEQKLLEVCDGSQWLSVRLHNVPPVDHSYGSVKLPGESCKDIMEKYKAVPRDGVYWIRLQGQRSSFPVYCDMKNGGWTLVFKAVSGSPTVPADLWLSSVAVNENDLTVLHLGKVSKDYKSRVVVHWKDFYPDEARVVLYKNGVNVLQIEFNAADSDNASWFSMSRVTNSPWTDLATKPKNIFSIAGLQQSNKNLRTFHINSHYKGCGDDVGWLVTSNSICTWETRLPLNSILYSKIGGCTNWNTYENVGVADVLTVFVR